MKKFIWFLLMCIAATSYSQIPVYGPNAGIENQACTIQTFSVSDSVMTSPPIMWLPNYQYFTGGATLAGRMDLTAGTDSITSFQARLIMNVKPAIDIGVAGLDMMYDSTGWHNLLAKSGDYVPAENGVAAGGHDFSIKLSTYNWWKPSIGIVVRAITYPAGNSTRSKRLEAYIIKTGEVK
jgi:hypothetical protein